MAFKRIAAFTNGIEIYQTNASPNGVISPIAVGSLAIVQLGGSVALWMCTALSSTWTNLSTGGSGVPLSSVTASVASTQVDNLAFTETFSYSTATAQVLLALVANALTTGTALDISTSSAALASTNGLLRVANTSAATAGILARFQANSTAGSGVTMLANGFNGFGLGIPLATIHNAGSTINTPVLIADKATGGVIGTAAATVDVASYACLTQTTAGQTVSLPSPTVATAGRMFWLTNTGSTPVTIYGAGLGAGNTKTSVWTGSTWSPA